MRQKIIRKNFDLDDKFSSFSKMNQIYYISPIKILCNNKYQCLTKVGDEADLNYYMG